MSDTCPYCPPNTSWGMSPDGWESMKKWHDAGHPQNQPEPPKGCICASFWTVRQTHKPDCPLYGPQSDELDEILWTLIATNKGTQVITPAHKKAKQRLTAWGRKQRVNELKSLLQNKATPTARSYSVKKIEARIAELQEGKND